MLTLTPEARDTNDGTAAFAATAISVVTPNQGLTVPRCCPVEMWTRRQQLMHAAVADGAPKPRYSWVAALLLPGVLAAAEQGGLITTAICRSD
jgi:hypothetical protein